MVLIFSRFNFHRSVRVQFSKNVKSRGDVCSRCLGVLFFCDCRLLLGLEPKTLETNEVLIGVTRAIPRTGTSSTTFLRCFISRCRQFWQSTVFRCACRWRLLSPSHWRCQSLKIWSALSALLQLGWTRWWWEIWVLMFVVFCYWFFQWQYRTVDEMLARSWFGCLLHPHSSVFYISRNGKQADDQIVLKIAVASVDWSSFFLLLIDWVNDRTFLICQLLFFDEWRVGVGELRHCWSVVGWCCMCGKSWGLHLCLLCLLLFWIGLLLLCSNPWHSG